jgi:hypothetical protein
MTPVTLIWTSFLKISNEILNSASIQLVSFWDAVLCRIPIVFSLVVSMLE